MAIITNQKLAKHRQLIAKLTTFVTWTKPQINDSVQAVVDLLQSPSSRTAVNNAIEAAAPGVFTADQKKLIFSLAASEVFEQEQG